MKDKKTPFLEKLRVTAEAGLLVLNFQDHIKPPDPPIDPPLAECSKRVDDFNAGMTESQRIFKEMRDRKEKLEAAEGLHRDQRERDIKRNSDALRDEKKFNARQVETKKLKHKNMSSKNEMLSQIKKNASDITSKGEQLKKKIEAPKDPLPGKKELVAKKFIESKPTVPSKKELLSKKEAFNTNKRDILGSKKLDTFKTNGKEITGKRPLENKALDKPKAELKPKVETKPDKPKPR